MPSPTKTLLQRMNEREATPRCINPLVGCLSATDRCTVLARHETLNMMPAAAEHVKSSERTFTERKTTHRKAPKDKHAKKQPNTSEAHHKTSTRATAENVSTACKLTIREADKNGCKTRTLQVKQPVTTTPTLRRDNTNAHAHPTWDREMPSPLRGADRTEGDQKPTRNKDATAEVLYLGRKIANDLDLISATKKPPTWTISGPRHEHTPCTQNLCTAPGGGCLDEAPSTHKREQNVCESSTVFQKHPVQPVCLLKCILELTSALS